MAYYNKYRRPALLGLGTTFTDETPCASIPACDSYRQPGNYCATTDGGYVTFNADGSTYGDPNGAGRCPSTWDRLGSAIGAILSPPAPTAPPVAAPGMSTTTKIALAGGAVLLVVLLTRR
jgi:hypothetical protein